MRYFLCFLCLPLWGDVATFYLSWHDDPTTTMTIQWISTEPQPLFIQNKQGWEIPAIERTPLESLWLQTVHLHALMPATTYFFRFQEDHPPYTFQTAPTHLKEPCRFVIGGDLYQNPKLFASTSRIVAAKEPLFAVLGGDLAYAVGFFRKGTELDRWITFLHAWSQTMITKKGRVIPLLAIPGNHDMHKGDPHSLFATLFALNPGPFYRRIDLGDYLSLLLLDTGYLSPIQGKQSEWLAHTLQNSQSPPYLFALYHEAAYPSVYPFEGTTPKAIRAHWLPLFEIGNVSAVFEHHNHTFKRTHPMRQGMVDHEHGITYFGDGCWGASPRVPHKKNYLAKREKTNCIHWVELTEQEASIETLNGEGKRIDHLTLAPRTKVKN